MKSSTDLPAVDVSYVREFSAEDVALRQYSTLDLCPFDGFTLLVGSREAWAGRFEQLESAMNQQGVKVFLRAADEDFNFVGKEAASLFATQGNLNAGGGLLVRPDQHLLASVCPDDNEHTLRRVICQHLGY